MLVLVRQDVSERIKRLLLILELSPETATVTVIWVEVDTRDSGDGTGALGDSRAVAPGRRVGFDILEACSTKAVVYAAVAVNAEAAGGIRTVAQSFVSARGETALAQVLRIVVVAGDVLIFVLLGGDVLAFADCAGLGLLVAWRMVYRFVVVH